MIATSTLSARDVALQVVRDVFAEHPRGAHESLDYRLGKAALDGRDRAFATELAYGAIKRRRRLDYELAPFLGDRAKTIPKPILEILRLGVYQLRFMHGVEAYAAVSESVGLARKYGHKGTAGLVNAVLRRVSEAEARPIESADPNDALAIEYSLPTWIVAHLRKRFGDERLSAILAGVNEPSTIGLSVDLRFGTRDVAIAALHDAGLPASPSAFAIDAIVVPGNAPSGDLERLAGKRWERHAEAACLPVDLLDPQPGDTVFEACSGRGNKTLQLASRMADRGRIEALDLDERKVVRARERLGLAGVRNTEMRVGDAELERGEPNCTRVLVDAPCSGLGIVGRQPESRWRKDPADSARLAVLQTAILQASATRLSPGGRLVYSVCTTDQRESEDVVAALLAARPEFTRVPLPERYAPLATAIGDVLIPPGIEGRDGFYIAVLTRS
jgi:16S rRNA (cytosine967-C5)-methyltransferase